VLDSEVPLTSQPWQIAEPNAGFSPDPTFLAGGAAKVTTCPASSNFANVCIDSGMSIFSQRPTTSVPDPNGAVGLSSLIAVTNFQIEGLRKDGTVLFGPTTFNEMFSILSPSFLFDPKIVYDVHQDRFVVVALDKAVDSAGKVTASRICLAVSKNDDPRSASSSDWYLLAIGSLVDGNWADFPCLAVDEEAVYITANMFKVAPPGGFATSLLWIVPKTPLYSGITPTIGRYDYVNGTSGTFRGSHAPAMVRKAGGIAPGVGTYLVMSLLSNSLGDDFVQIVQINSPLNSATFRGAIVHIGDIAGDQGVELNDGPQRDTPRLVETNDRRALSAVWVGNHLWMTMTVSDGTQTAANWVKFEANGIDFPPRFVDKGIINGESIWPGTFTAFPSLDVNSKGIVAFGFAAFSSSFYPSAYATIRDDLVDPSGTVRPPDLVRAGEGPYYIDFGLPSNRWGDYSAVAVDPANEDCFWIFNEFAGSETYTSSIGSTGQPQFGSWKTAWARLCYTSPSCRAVGEQCSDVAQCCTPARICESFNGEPKTCQLCRNVNEGCSDVSECCAPANLCTTAIGGPKTCQVCRSVGQQCSSVSECCAPANSCTGPLGGPKACQVCRGLNEVCSSVSECCAPANLCAGPVGGPQTCQVRTCRSVGQRCSSAAECCSPSGKICEGPTSRTKTCQTCRAAGRPCLRAAQCCSPAGAACDGPAGRTRSCKRCLRTNARCSRHSQCCRGLLCKAARCRP
jgi:hypothetical protein